MLSVSLRQLEYAVATARHGGVTAAALVLHVSQPALSVALAQLESVLGRPLFLRRPGGRLALTTFGRAWLEQAESQLTALHRLVSGDTASVDVRIAIFEDLAPGCLAALLAQVARCAPEVTLHPAVMGFEPLAAALHSGRADLALTWDLGLESGIARAILAQVPPHAVMAADHPLANRPALTLADLASQPLILADQGLSIGHMRALFSQRGLVARIAHRTPTLELMRSFAANGFGIGLSYTNPAVRHAHDGKPLAARTLTDAGTEPLVLAHLAVNPLSQAARRVAELVPATLPFAVPHAK